MRPFPQNSVLRSMVHEIYIKCAPYIKLNSDNVTKGFKIYLLLGQ